MKELSIEEKAKAYDEAIAHAKILLKTIGNATLGNLVLKNEFENMFHELKESEDERIRRELISLFADGIKGINHRYTGEDCERWLAWIEKQGQDGKVWFYRDDYVRDKKQAHQDGIDDVLNNPQKYGLEKQGEQKPAELLKCEDYGIDGLYAAIDILQKTLGKVDGYQTDDGILEHECAISAVKKLYEQKHWKPSDEQMAALNDINLTGSISYVGQGQELISLYNFLKKLREE